MDVKAWTTISRLLDEALDLPPAARTTWLESLDPEYEEFKPRLRAMLAEAHGSNSGVLDTLPKLYMELRGEAEDAEDFADDGSRAGSMVGPYRLVREIAAGGQGSVWLAERPDGLINRPVAIKLPIGLAFRPGLAERMARERNILASLTHTNIARLYDAGVTSHGEPFLAIEFVDGVPIDRYCALNALRVDQILPLFLQVVSAVAHAHARLVVHRDLKPSNILVTSDGQVKLLDFGISALLDADSPESRPLTQVGGRALTLDYASPEQVAGREIRTTSDVYSLGVVFYELLTGMRPYQFNGEWAAAFATATAEADPRRPSQLAPKDRQRALSGDLDWITLKAMARTPSERYATVNAFADDIGRHLRQEPVEASPPSARYRFGKFARRHRVGLAASAVVLLSLVAGIVVATLGLVRARASEAEARRLATVAQAETATAERVSQFMVDLFTGTKPEEADGREVTARQILDNGVERIRRELASEPLIQSRLLRTAGDAYSSLAFYDRARPIVEDAVAVARKSGAPAQLELVRGLQTLAQLQRRVDDVAGAERSLREALAVLDTVHPADPDLLGRTLNELALLQRTRNPDEAIALFKRTYDLIAARDGTASGDAGIVLANIGSIYTRTRRYEEAKRTFEQALPVVTAYYGENDPRVSGVIGNLALAERQLGNFDTSLRLQQRDLELSTRAYGADHPTLGMIWLNLARTSEQVGRYPSAIEQVDKALAIFAARFAPNHGLRMTAGNTHAALLDKMGRVDEARTDLTTLAALTPESPEGRAAQLVTRLQLAEIERHAGRTAAALLLIERVSADAAAAKDIKLIADAAWARACLFAGQGRGQDAEQARRAALALHEKDSQVRPESRLYAQARFSACAGDHKQALALLESAVAQGFADPVVLVDGAFVRVREEQGFSRIASGLRR